MCFGKLEESVLREREAGCLQAALSFLIKASASEAKVQQAPDCLTDARMKTNHLILTPPFKNNHPNIKQ